MKKVFIVLSICLFYLNLNGFSQDNALITDSGTVYKKGFYLSYEEFRTNSPSLFVECEVITDDEFINLFAEPHIRYKLIFPENIKLESSLEVWGYCDGKNIYVKRSGGFKKRSKYDILLTIGLYCHYKSSEMSGGGMYYVGGAGGGHMSGGSSKSVIDIFINFNTGEELSSLTKNDVREIIKNDKEISASFELETTKYKRSTKLEYVLKYSNKHKEEITRTIQKSKEY